MSHRALTLSLGVLVVGVAVYRLDPLANRFGVNLHLHVYLVFLKNISFWRNEKEYFSLFTFLSVRGPPPPPSPVARMNHLGG